jgi:hypothetical protein
MTTQVVACIFWVSVGLWFASRGTWQQSYRTKHQYKMLAIITMCLVAWPVVGLFRIIVCINSYWKSTQPVGFDDSRADKNGREPTYSTYDLYVTPAMFNHIVETGAHSFVLDVMGQPDVNDRLYVIESLVFDRDGRKLEFRIGGVVDADTCPGIQPQTVFVTCDVDHLF